MDFLVKGLQWPPPDHKERLQRYDQNKKLFKGLHKDVYPYWAQKMAQEQQDFIELIVNLPGMLSKLSADLLFGEFPSFRADAEDDDPPAKDDAEAKKEKPEQEALERLIKRNKLHRVNYQLALGTSYRGDGLIKVRYGKRTTYSKEPEAIIEEIPPSIWYPVTSPDNVSEIEYHVLAWMKKIDDKTSFLRAELHFPGKVENQLWLLKDSKLYQRVEWSTAQKMFAEYAEIEESVDTGLDFPLIFHIPNFAVGDETFGIDDYMELDTLFQEINARLSQVSLVLNKHADPNMYGDPMALEVDPFTGVPRLRSGGKFFPVNPGDQAPGYVTWDGQLTAAFSQMDKLLEMIFYVADVAPALFGFDKTGAASSGTALKLRLIRTLAKINRKRIYFDDALKNALYAAQLLEQKFGRPPEGTYNADRPHIEWKDGLPQDAMEAAQIEQIRTGSKATTSIKSAIRRLDGLEDDQIERELQEIEKEQTPPPMSPVVQLPGQQQDKQPPEGGQGT